MRKNINLALFIMGLTALSGCTSTVETYHPGYYQEGHWVSGGYQPAYYDVYGNLHPAQQVQAYYEKGAWHRPYVTTTEIKEAPSVSPSGSVVDPLATAIVVPSGVNATIEAAPPAPSPCVSCF